MQNAKCDYRFPIPDPRRTGFTLIELLIVIAVIAILSGLITVAGLGFVNRARVAATSTTISKVDEAILERVSAINRWHELPYSRLNRSWQQRGWVGSSPNQPSRWQRYCQALGRSPQRILSGDNATSQGLMETLSRKESMKEAFPITQAELKRCFWFWAKFETNGARESGLVAPNFIPLSAPEQANMQAFLDDMDLDPATAPPQTLDRTGEIFFYVLTNAPVFGGLPMVLDDFEENELIDPDADGVFELGDAWNQPLRFYRWPTRLVNNGEPFNTNPQGTPINTIASANWNDADNVATRGTLMPNAPTALKADPDDPAAALANTGMTLIFHDTYTWSAPLVVSAGTDGRLGLDEPNVSLPITMNGNTIDRYGLARPLSSTMPTPAPVPAPTEPPDPKFDEFLYDNITNHTIDGGL